MAYTTIDKSDDYFNTVLWNGNSSTQAITGVGFQPDFNWIKVRTQADNHILSDSVRSLNTLNSDRTTQELGPKLSSFDSDGFTCTSDSSVNGTGQTYVGWNWLAGGTAVSNTDGDMTSSVSANTTSGFSIATYTGDGVNGSTFGHGLGVTPKVVIIKSRSLGTEDWHFWYNNSSRFNLNNTNAVSAIAPISTSSTLVTTPSSTNDSWNGSGQTYVSYCFAEKKGFSKFGTYTGNGSTDGPFIYTGFKPAFVIAKNSSSTGNWGIFDNKRDSYNVCKSWLFADNTNAENTSFELIDLTSNGFKLRYPGGASINASGNTYFYMAFAENPLVTSGGTPTTAR